METCSGVGRSWLETGIATLGGGGADAGGGGVYGAPM